MNYWNERNKPYQPGQAEAYKVSRSKIELFTQCRRCFWLDIRQKIKRPSGPPFQINKAVDELLKKEFDSYREKSKPHPLMVDNDIKAVPFQHSDLNKWRHNFTGVSTLHKPTNLHIFGAIDDIWVDSDGQVMVVDYKATAKSSEISLDADWQVTYKRQMEIYQWLLRQNGFSVSDTGYFVYTNGRLDMDGFNDRIEFRTKIIPYTGDASWVDQTITEMKLCMDSNELQPVGTAVMGGTCEFCLYAKARQDEVKSRTNKTSKKNHNNKQKKL